MACNVLQLSLYRTNCRTILNAKSLFCTLLPSQKQNASYSIFDINSSAHQVMSTNHPAVQSCRSVTTKPVSFFKNIVDGYKFKSALKKIGIMNFRKSSLKRKGFNIYENVADNIHYKSFFTKYNLPDTFNSWFLVMELHLWMIMVRLMTEEEEGRFLRNCIIEALWEDVKEKIGHLGEEHTSTARSQLTILSQQFQAALLSYDEGLLSNDMVLAGAIWRRLLSRECNEPEIVEDLVRYVRKQVKMFDSLTREEIFSDINTFEFKQITDRKSAVSL